MMQSSFKQFYLLLLLVLLISICACKRNVTCDDQINYMPMYGNAQKCDDQLKRDEAFLMASDAEEPDRQKAVIRQMELTWYNLHQGLYDKAMEELNRAWLLDKENVIVYSSFVVLLDLTNKTDEAKDMMDQTLRKIRSRKDPITPTDMDPSNYKLTEFVVANTAYVYKKTDNPTLGKYLYEKLDKVKLEYPDKNRLKDMLKAQIPEIGE